MSSFLMHRRLMSSTSNVTKLAMVTGAASGIGQAVARILSNREGYSVIAADLKGADETISSLSRDGKHLNLSLDVSKKEAVQSTFEQIISTYNTVPTILVNCAGITRDAMMKNMSEDKFNEVMNVNVNGTFYPTQSLCQLLRDRNLTGAIVNVSSTSGKYGNVGQTNYSASKAAVIGLTKAVAKEMGRYGIRCNAVIPGFIDTPMTKSVPDHISQMVMMATALNRPGKPEEVAEGIVFLATERSSYITGTTIDVTGGMFC